MPSAPAGTKSIVTVSEKMRCLRRGMRLGSHVQKRLGLRGGGRYDDCMWEDELNDPGFTQIRLVEGADEPHVVLRKDGFPDFHFVNVPNYTCHKLEQVGWQIVAVEPKHQKDSVPCILDFFIPPRGPKHSV